MATRKQKKRPPEVIHVGPEGEEIPARLMSDLKGAWSDLETVRVKRRSKVLATVPVISEPTVEGIQPSTILEIAAQAYAHATEHAEGEGDGLYTFEGLGRLEDDLVTIVFRRSLRITIDSEGETGSEDSDPTTRIIEASALTVEKFGALATRAVADQISQHDSYMEGLKVLRQQLIEQAKIMRDLDSKALHRDELAMDHAQSMAKIEGMTKAFESALMTMAPQLATLLAGKASQEGVKGDGGPPPPPEDKVTQQPCQEAAQLQRILERMGEKMEAFREQFRDDRWAHVEVAMGAKTTHEFDSGIRHLFLSHGITEKSEAVAEGTKWFEVVPEDARVMALPVLLQCSQRLKWPLKS